MYEGRRVLVTGGTGMIGSSLVDELLARGANVRIVSHQRPNHHGDAVEDLRGDLLDPGVCERAVDGMEIVVHAAGVGGGSGKVAVAPIGMFTDNLRMNTQVIEAARLAGVQSFGFLSNSSVYASSDDPLPERDAWGESIRGLPENETGTVKRTGETQCNLYSRFSDMKIGIVRGGNAYGPHDNFDLESSHVLPALVRKAVERHDPFVLWGSGEPRRDFTHARDIARGLLHVIEHHAVAEPVNIATGRATSIREAAEIILAAADYSDARIELKGDAPRVGAAKLLDVTKMRELGFEPETPFEDGARETVDWFREAQALAR